jgi:negative regulator of flagellin synthesis FlgM
MEISGRGRTADLAKLLLGVQEVGQTSGKYSAKPSRQGDRVQISDQAKELQRIKALTNEPDHARAEKVERIRQAIDNGTYSVEGRKVGDAIIRHALMEQVL